jgi:hypothetical protein
MCSSKDYGESAEDPVPMRSTVGFWANRKLRRALNRVPCPHRFRFTALSSEPTAALAPGSLGRFTSDTTPLIVIEGSALAGNGELQHRAPQSRPHERTPYRNPLLLVPCRVLQTERLR